MEQIQPTIRQKLVFNDVVKGSTISGAMIKRGYSPSTSKRTNKITNTKGWQYLVNKHISDEKLARVHAEGLAATKYESRLTGKGESELQEVPDYSVRHKYLESGYKVKGKYSQEGNTNNILVINVSGESAIRYGTTPRTEEYSE